MDGSPSALLLFGLRDREKLGPVAKPLHLNSTGAPILQGGEECRKFYMS